MDNDSPKPWYARTDPDQTFDALVKEARDSAKEGDKFKNSQHVQAISCYEKAIQYYEEARKLNSSKFESLKQEVSTVYNDCGRCRTRTSTPDRLDRAIADYDEALRLKSDFAWAYNNRGWAYNNKGEYDRAIADYDQALRLKLDFAWAYNNRGLAYNNKGEYDLAIADLKKAYDLKPDNETYQSKLAAAYNNRGWAYSNKGEYDRAIADYDQAIRLKLDFARAYYNRGLAYNNKGEYVRAIQDYTEAIKFDEKEEYLINRLDSYIKIGDTNKAREDLDTIKKNNPKCPGLKKREEQIKTLENEECTRSAGDTLKKHLNLTDARLIYLAARAKFLHNRLANIGVSLGWLQWFFTVAMGVVVFSGYLFM